jgi:hypothetical protein
MIVVTQLGKLRIELFGVPVMTRTIASLTVVNGDQRSAAEFAVLVDSHRAMKCVHGGKERGKKVTKLLFEVKHSCQFFTG